MKKTIVFAAAASLLMASCGSTGTVGTGSSGSSKLGSILSSAGSTETSSTSSSKLGSILGSSGSTETITNVLSSVIGLDKLKTKNLVGTWQYDGPGCAFTSDNALAKAGGEIAATDIESKLQTQYDKLGLTSSNTSITFSEDGTFSSKISGKSFNGKWTFDESTSQVNLKATLLTLNGYVKRNGTGISLLFEATKLLTLMQTMASLSGNTTLQTVSDLSKNYDGLRIGFDMK